MKLEYKLQKTKHLLPYEKREPSINTMDKGYHQEFLVQHDMSSRCVVTYNRLSYNIYHGAV